MSSRAVQPDLVVAVLPALAVLTQRPHARGELGVVGRQRTRVAHGAEVLAGIEAEGRRRPAAAGAAAVALGSVCLAGVLDEREPVSSRDALAAPRMSAIWP